jgi:PDZ domain-containing protein
MMTVRSSLSALAALTFVAFVALCVYAFVTPSSSYLLLPDHPHPLAPIVEVKGEHPTGRGGFYFVDVVERQASLAERYVPFLRDGGELVSEQDLVPSNLNERQSERLDVAAMALSKTTAEAVALQHLGYHVVVHPLGTRIEQIVEGSPAATKLLPGDVIEAVNGKAALTDTRLRALVERHRVGQTIVLTIIRAGQKKRLAIRTYSLQSSPRVPMIGVVITQAASIKLPTKVKINAGNVVGPSAGLAFALELTEKLGGNVDRGYRVAATGELTLGGGVIPIGGVEQKVTGARRAGIEIMLLPAGENATEARRYAGDMKIIAVTSFQQALRALATLPLRK